MHRFDHKLLKGIRSILWLLLTVPTLQASPPRSADAILDAVIAQLPRAQIQAEGTIFVRQRRGIPLETYRFTLEARWHTDQTRVAYTIRDNQGTPLEALTFHPDETERFSFRQGANLEPAPLPDLTANIARTDLSWLDLTLYFLWWRGARHVGEDTVRGFHCHTIEVDAPPGNPYGNYASVRLWVSSEQGLLLQAEGLDDRGRPIRRLWVQSVRQIEDQWMIQTLEVQQSNRDQRTRLQIIDVEIGTDIIL